MNFTMIKNYLKIVRSFIFDIIYGYKWKVSKNRRKNDCLNKNRREHHIVVSLTSFPERIGIVYKTIQTILNQKNIKPDAVELWLAAEQFPNFEKDLPSSLLMLKKYGLEICWCHDLRSYKKLIPALKKHSDSIIVTSDDDVYYGVAWLEKLYREYDANAKNIYCHRATKFEYHQGEFSIQGGGRNYYHEPSFLNKLVGVGGVMYSPGVLHEDIFKENIFMKYAPTNDDIWFWFMAIKNSTMVKVVDCPESRPINVLGSEKTSSLTSVNDNGQKLFWKDFKNLIIRYPEVKGCLIQEWNEKSDSRQLDNKDEIQHEE